MKFWLLSGFLLLLSACGGEESKTETPEVETPETQIPEMPSAEQERLVLQDDLMQLNSANWFLADGWSNGSPFLSGWCHQAASFDAEGLTIQLSKQACSGEVYQSTEYRTQQFYGYGRYEAELKAAKGSGQVNGFFSYTGPSDDGNAHHEIDIEILGQDTSRVQFNYYTGEDLDGDGFEDSHEATYDLGFDAADAFHHYAYEWRADSIKWYVDGKLLHQVEGKNLPSLASRWMFNLWACSADSWCGAIDDAALPSQMQVKNAVFTEFLD